MNLYRVCVARDSVHVCIALNAAGEQKRSVMYIVIRMRMSSGIVVGMRCIHYIAYCMK